MLKLKALDQPQYAGEEIVLTRGYHIAFFSATFYVIFWSKSKARGGTKSCYTFFISNLFKQGKQGLSIAWFWEYSRIRQTYTQFTASSTLSLLSPRPTPPTHTHTLRDGQTLSVKFSNSDSPLEKTREREPTSFNIIAFSILLYIILVWNWQPNELFSRIELTKFFYYKLTTLRE